MARILAWPKRLINSGHVVALAAAERRIPYLPLERIERLRDRRLRSVVLHAYETVPYYRRTMDELGLQPSDFQTVADLAKLPLLDDALVRQDPSQFASTLFDDQTRRTMRTSGSTSYTRKEIYWDAKSMLKQSALAARDRKVVIELTGQRWRRRQLYIFPTTGSVVRVMAMGDAQKWVPNAVVQRQVFSAAEPFETLVAKLNEFRPHVVYSYGSFAEHFFRFLADAGTSPILPRVWRYSGDMLSPGGKELIERRFGCTVYSTYQSVETGRVGYQCERRQGFHLNVDFCALRVVDGSGRDLPAGEDGEIIISNLLNRAMVLLNYRLGDRGTLAEQPCQCGRTLPVLEQLTGRQSQLISLRDGRVLPSLVVVSHFPRQLASALKAQVAQPAPGQIRWRIVPFAGVDRNEMRRALIARSREVLGEEMDLDVEFVDDIPPTQGGKFPLIVTSDNPR